MKKGVVLQWTTPIFMWPCSFNGDLSQEYAKPHGVFTNQSTYIVDDVGAISGTIKALRISARMGSSADLPVFITSRLGSSLGETA